MNISEAFLAAYDRAVAAGAGHAGLLPTHLTRACVDVLPVSGAGMALFTGAIRVPLGASDEAAADAERLQFTTGEGPCIHAHRTGSTVVVGADEMCTRWPLFHSELLARTQVRSIVAVPLGEPLTGLGTVDLYFRHPRGAYALDLRDVTVVVDRMAELLIDAIPLPTATMPGLVPPGWLSRPLEDRSDVVVAMGMLNTALELSGRQALDVLRGHAFATENSLDETAHDVVTGSLPLNDLAPDAD